MNIQNKRPAFYTPLRYPGGKGKIAPFIKSIIEQNDLMDGYYAEPYAGGAAVALELLFQEYVTHIHINDISPSVAAFWRSVLYNSENLCKKIQDTPVTIEEWNRQKALQVNSEQHDDLTLGFSTFFLNRTNRSGILKAGVIGGKSQSGNWKLDARYNVQDLIKRIQAIANQSRRITFSQLDAKEFISYIGNNLPSKTLIYLDPPYFIKGKDLYHHHYSIFDHQRISELIPIALRNQHWIVSYDDVPQIRELYKDYQRISYGLTYSAQSRYQGSEVMFFDNLMKIPQFSSSMKKVEENKKVA
ncbi:DNA adenine methylase [Methylobacillus sp.]|uniref:DNA adenine methylase n=1 Tax=Methylobacillus sp. TaxID=56818 RepID=UPI0012C64507|nr:DNA adenine methylase [Methylobacillus sp.]MPS47816.1 DNA adenine methylase [Methylobacillus sp.]